MEGPGAARSPPSASSVPSGDGQQGQPGKHTSAPSPEDTSGPGSWQTDSLASSWATVGTLDPEEAKSLDASEERSENHSSTSDIVHLEREEAELLEEAERQAEAEAEARSLREVGELQSSVMSVLGTDTELAELRGDAPRLKAPETMEMLMSVEEPDLQEEPEEVVWPLLSSTPPPGVPEPAVSAPGLVDPKFQPLAEVPPSPPRLEQQPPEKALKEEKRVEPKELPIPPSPQAPQLDTPRELQTEPAVAPLAVEESFHISTKQAPATQEPEPPATPPSALELSTLLYGSAAVVAVMGMVAYGALALSRK